MTPFEVYVDYSALKQHFTTESYDYIKYNGKIRANIDNFNKRKDKYFFEKLAKTEDPHAVLIASLCINPKCYIRDIANNHEKILKNHQRVIQSLSHTFKNDIKNLKTPFDDNIIIKDNNLPYLIQLYIGNKISLESLTIIACLSQCLLYWEKKLKNISVVTEIILCVKKYNSFLYYDSEKYKKILLDYFMQ